MYLSEHIVWCPKNKRHPPRDIFSRGQNSSSPTNTARCRRSKQIGRAQKILELGQPYSPISPSFPLQGESKPDWGNSHSLIIPRRSKSITILRNERFILTLQRLQVYHHPSENSRPDRSHTKRTSGPLVEYTVLAELERARVATQPDSSRVKRTAGIFVILTVLAQLE